MTDEQALTILDADVTLLDDEQATPYGDDLARAGYAAENAIHTDVFGEYHAGTRPNTQRRQLADLKHFCAYLKEAGVKGDPVERAKAFYNDPEAWRGMNYALLRGYLKWAAGQSCAAGTMNVRLSTIHQYCKLAGPKPEGAGVLSEETLVAILTVRGLSAKKAANLDEDRAKAGIPTRKGHKKAQATDIATYQALQLKKTTKHTKKPYNRPHDHLLAVRDALMVGLLVEHALRCSEVAALNIENINLAQGTVTFTRRKTKLEPETQAMHPHTMMAAAHYLEAVKQQAGRMTGPLFVGYQGKRITDRAINARVGELGKQIGVEKLSPHDLRHFWSYDALRNGTPIDKVMAGAGWETHTMAVRYAKRLGLTNEGVKITTEE